MTTNVAAVPDTDLPTDAELMRMGALALVPLTAPATRHLPQVLSWLVTPSGLTGQLSWAVDEATAVGAWAEYLETTVQHGPFTWTTTSTKVFCQSTVMDFPVEIWTATPTPTDDSEADQ